MLCLQRLDAVLFNIGATLILVAQYARHTRQETITATLLLMMALSVSVNITWSRLLARLGIHVVAYGTLLLSMAVFLGGLASWGIVS